MIMMIIAVVVVLLLLVVVVVVVVVIMMIMIILIIIFILMIIRNSCADGGRSWHRADSDKPCGFNVGSGIFLKIKTGLLRCAREVTSFVGLNSDRISS